ncbi:MAG: ribosomal protein L7/L12, partial [Myxococcota bacterium]
MTDSFYTAQELEALKHRVTELERQVALLTDLVREAQGVPASAASAACDLVLLGSPPHGKIQAIKAVREVTGVGLAEAK